MLTLGRVTPTALALLGLLAAGPAAGQRTQTLLDGDFESGGFGGPMLQVMPYGDDAAVFMGGRGGWIINHVFSIGGGAWGLVSELPEAIPSNAPPNTRLVVGYGGVIVEYTVRPHELIHWGASLLSGWGTAGYSTDLASDPDPDSFFVLEPTVHAEVNVTDFFRVALGASYRYTSGIELERFTDADMQEVAGAITFKFGAF